MAGALTRVRWWCCALVTANVLVALSGCGGGEGEQRGRRGRPEVVVARPQQRTVESYYDYTGSLEAVQRVEVRARVPGYLEQVLFEDSTDVEAGQLLFVIEQAPYEMALQRARGELQQAQAQLERAEFNAARIERLMEQEAAADLELVEARAEAATQRGAVEIARAEVRDAELNLEYTEVRAPFAGRIDRNYVDVGNLVGAGEPTRLATIVQRQPIYCYFDVSERIALEYLSRGRTGNVREYAPRAFLGLQNEQGFPHEGRITYVDNVLNPATGTIRVRATFSNERDLLYPGLFARIRVPFQVIEDAVLIEERAVATDLQGEYILVVGADDVVARRVVQLGRRYDNGYIHVRSGLGADERYIVAGLQKARPGSAVNPRMEADTTTQPSTQRTRDRTGRGFGAEAFDESGNRPGVEPPGGAEE